jgi:hypothetical protein
MLAAGIALLVVGVIFLFIVPFVGVPLGIIGLVLLGFHFWVARRAATGDTR